METLSPAVRRLARASLVVLWMATTATTLIAWQAHSEQLLQQTSVPTEWHDRLMLGGALLDAAVGLALWRWHRRAVYALAGANVLLMTLVASIILPSLWLDPLGSLTKNLPIAALLWILYRDARS